MASCNLACYWREVLHLDREHHVTFHILGANREHTSENCQTNEGCGGNPIGTCNDSHAYHELSGLDIVTCVALIQTNHGKVNMLIHEYVYYGRGNTIHSPCQIEWFNNTCDDKSHHVGGKPVITFLDGYAAPLKCRSSLMYMSILGKPTDQDLDQYHHVCLTSPLE